MQDQSLLAVLAAPDGGLATCLFLGMFGNVQAGELFLEGLCLGLNRAWCETPSHRAWGVALPESRLAQLSWPLPDVLWSPATHSVAPGQQHRHRVGAGQKC